MTRGALGTSLRDLVRLVYGAVFLQMAPDFTAAGIADRADVPALSACFRRIATGELSLQSSRGQALVGAAILNQVA
jgi:hypothetical protein